MGAIMSWKRWYPWSGALLAGFVLVLGGFGYRRTSGLIDAELAARIELSQPLSTLPMVIGDWAGEDVPIRESVQKIAMNDDFVNRRYRNRASGEVINLYVAYTARPRTMLRHRPGVCYPSAGWSPVGEEDTALTLPQGGTLPVRIHRFTGGEHSAEYVTVLNYYVLNGKPTIDEHSFWSLGWRTPNLARDASRYVAQIQVTTVGGANEDQARRVLIRFAGDSAEDIMRLLPGRSEPDI